VHISGTLSHCCFSQCCLYSATLARETFGSKQREHRIILYPEHRRQDSFVLSFRHSRAKLTVLGDVIINKVYRE
jgi:hypothetical protein